LEGAAAVTTELDPKLLADLEQAIADYRAILQSIPQQATPSPEQISDLQLTRDQVDSLYRRANGDLPAAVSKELDELDRQLRKTYKRIQAERKKQLEHSLHSSRWWQLKDPDPLLSVWDRFDGIWQFGSQVTFALTAALIVELAGRVLAGGLDVWGSSAVLVQSVLTLVVGKQALTAGGRESIHRGLARLGLPKGLWDEITLLLSLLLLATIWGTQQVGLPMLARFYQCLGDADLIGVEQFPGCLPWVNTVIVPPQRFSDEPVGNQRIASAEANYQRSLNIDPSQPQVYLALGTIYQSLQELEQAQTTYEKAIKGGQLEAYNGLAQVEIKRGEANFSRAANWLWQGLNAAKQRAQQNRIFCTDSLSPATCEASRQQYRLASYQLMETFTRLTTHEKGKQYSNDAAYWLSFWGLPIARAESSPLYEYNVQKNLGWVRLMQQDLDQAESHLNAAIALDTEKAAAHCLMAQVIDQRVAQLTPKQTEAQPSSPTPTALSLQDQARFHWQQCVYASRLENVDERVWHNQGQNRLKQLGNVPANGR